MGARDSGYVVPALVLLAAATSAFAEDIEIYSGDKPPELKPNVVFIIDTSGSMKTEQVEVASSYAPATAYKGACPANRVYWSADESVPSCSGSQWFYDDTAHNTCKSSRAALDAAGTFSDQAAMWDPASRKWIALSGDDHTRMVECEDDFYKKHGQVDSVVDVYPDNDAAGPWTNSWPSFSWSSTYPTYTLYSGNYLNYLQGGGVPGGKMSRLKLVKVALSRMLDSLDGVNIAFMRFSDANSASDLNNLGGYFITPMLEVNAVNRPKLKAAIEGLGIDGDPHTALAETMYEAGLYFRGEQPHFGLGKNDPGVTSGGKYLSPITHECDRNFIVLFSDGDPQYDGDGDTEINGQPGFGKHTKDGKGCKFNLWPEFECLMPEAEYLYKEDVSPVTGLQSVVTYTVGFEDGMSTTGKKYMKEAATRGGGFYLGASNPTDLIDAFKAVMSSVLTVNATFSAPAVPVNSMNRLTQSDELYFPLFRSGSLPRWDGNIKRYRLGAPKGSTAVAILDVDGAAAVDPATGTFKKTATSFWPATDAAGARVADGEEVTLGGAASHMPEHWNRHVYTCCFGGRGELKDSANKMAWDNPNLTRAVVGATTDNERVDVISWAMGADVYDIDMDGETTDARPQMGDPLHTEPLLVTYGKRGDGTPDVTLFTTTNEGFLHAIDTATGVEQFAYMPKELLGNLRRAAKNSGSGHLYGLDGPMTAWVYDKDHDGVIDAGDDHVYLYLSMRRGGRNIYALDVTDRSNPKQIWMIAGGVGGFAELGQTWSKPVLAKVMFKGEERQVLIFGGGYDVNQDGIHTADNPSDYAEDDTMGRGVFMVDATDENVAVKDPLWSAGAGSGVTLRLSQMTNSIPSEVRVLDVDGDGFADRMYVGDMRGRVWRFDMPVGSTTAAGFATGGILASLGVESSTSGNRRFYYPPSVSMSVTGGYLNIAVGSGYREHPLKMNVHDRFYVLRDRDVDGPRMNASGTPIYDPLTSLVDATSWVTAADKAALSGSDGFYIDLNEADGTWVGEKVLAQALTYNGIVAFTTFTPTGLKTGACAPDLGQGKIYYMHVEDSTGVDGSGSLGSGGGTGRSSVIKGPGIPPRPVVINVDGESVAVAGPGSPPRKLPPLLPYKNHWRRK